jgi:hypothetical protein
MAQRLEKMERLISDFAIEPKSIDDTPSVSEESQSGDSPKDKPPRKSPTVVLPSIEESDYGWGTQLPPLENGREPFRQDRYIPHLLTDGEDNGYNGNSKSNRHTLFPIQSSNLYRVLLYIFSTRN